MEHLLEYEEFNELELTNINEMGHNTYKNKFKDFVYGHLTQKDYMGFNDENIKYYKQMCANSPYCMGILKTVESRHRISRKQMIVLMKETGEISKSYTYDK